MNYRTLTFLAVALFCLPAALAYSMDSYNMSFTMQKRVVHTEVVIDFNESVTDVLLFTLPRDTDRVEVRLDGEKTDTALVENTLQLNLSDTSRIWISYASNFYLDKDDFLYDFSPPFDVSKLSIKLKLPENGRLEQAIGEGRGSIHPKPTQATTDGERLIFVWERENLRAGDELAIYTKIRQQRSWPIPVIVAVATALAVLVTVVFRKPRKDVEQHLKEDEQVIINVLKERDGQRIEQGTLRVVTGFSKASLSRLLMELEERKIIHKEKRGKKNLVFLKK